MMKKLVLFLFLCIMVVGCYNTLLPIRIPTRSPKIPENSIIKDIPKYPNNKPYIYYKFTKQKQKQLNLSSPENGYDSLMFRIWFTYPEGLHQFGELLEIQFRPNQEPLAKYYRLSLFFNPTREYEVINSFKDTTIISPKSGWNSLIKIIDILKINELPTMENLSEFQEPSSQNDLFNNTSLTVSTEVATLTKYRFFEYNNFEKYESIDEVNKIFSFIKYIRDEFYMFPIDTNWYKE